MPNWCANNLTVEHDDPTMLDKFVEAFKAGKVCETFIGKNPEGTDWYDWNIANWGTKWNVGGKECDEPVRDGKSVVVSFYSAWSPAIPLYEKMLEDGFRIHASYFEPGQGFCGTWINGWDNYIDYEKGTSR